LCLFCKRFSRDEVLLLKLHRYRNKWLNLARLNYALGAASERRYTRIQLSSYSRAAAQCRNRKINNGAAGRRSKPVIQFIFFPPLSLFRSLIVFVCIPLERGLPDASRAAAITASFKLLDAAFDVTRHLVFSVLRKSHLNL
jgi:hypothetical protein